MTLRACLAAATLAALVHSAQAAPGDPPDNRFASSPPDISGVWATLVVSRPDGTSAFADPPLSENGRRLTQEFRGRYDLTGMEPNAHCVEPGMPTMLFGYGGAPIEILQEPDRITILTELAMQVRRIYLDGRPHPEWPHTRSGHSIARWEGDTLVVETALLSEWLLPRWPHTEDARIEERFRLIPLAEADLRAPFRGWRPEAHSDPVLIDEMTITDPAMYDEPQHLFIVFSALPDDMIQEDNCPEGLWWDVMKTLEKD